MGAHQNLAQRCAFIFSLTLGIAAVPATSVQALVPVGGGGGGGGGGGAGGGSTGPELSPGSGPGLPYISGRLGGAQRTATSPPSGTVVPDDFCLPGKFVDCGEHLRGGPDHLTDTPIFVGNEDLGFNQANSAAWANGEFRRTSIDSLSENREMVSYSIGVDRKIGDRFVFGAMVVSSQSSVVSSVTGIEDQSSGFFAGPYFAVQLSDTLTLDGRYYLGTADHVVTTTGAQTGRYQSQNSFAALRVSADIENGNWRILPSLELARITQDDNAYTDTLRGLVPASAGTQSFITASALGYYNGFQGITPYVGLEVSQEVGGGGMSGTIRTGATMAFGNGATLNFDYAYGGIGLNGTDDQQISIRFEIPF